MLLPELLFPHGQDVVKQVLSAIRAVAGNDDVKDAIVDAGATELIVLAISHHLGNPQVPPRPLGFPLGWGWNCRMCVCSWMNVQSSAVVSNVRVNLRVFHFVVFDFSHS